MLSGIQNVSDTVPIFKLLTGQETRSDKFTNARNIRRSETGAKTAAQTKCHGTLKRERAHALMGSGEEASGNEWPEMSHVGRWGFDRWRCWRRAFLRTA